MFTPFPDSFRVFSSTPVISKGGSLPDLVSIAGQQPSFWLDFTTGKAIEKIGGRLGVFNRPSSSKLAWNGNQLVEFAADQLGLQFNFATGQWGCLLEPAATNICLRQNMTSGNGWGQPTSGSVNLIASQYGIPFWHEWIESSATEARLLSRIESSYVASTRYTASFYVSPVPGAPKRFPVIVFNAAAFGTIAAVSFDLDTGATLHTGGFTTGQVFNLGNGLYRISATMPTTGAGASAIQLRLTPTADLFTGTYAGANQAVMRVGLPQFEVGSIATSPILTGVSAVTRAADMWTWTGPAFSSWYNQAGGV